MNLETYNSSVGIQPAAPPYERPDTSVGNALQGFGATLGNVDEHLQDMQDRDGAMWVVTTMAQQQKNYAAKIASAQASGNIPPGFYEQLNSDMEKSYQQLLKGAPNSRSARDMLTHHFASMATQFGDHAMRLEAAYHGGNILGMAQQAVNDAIETGQTTGNWKLTADTSKSVVAALRGNVPDRDVQNFTQQTGQAIDSARLGQESQTNPEGAAEGIESGTLGSSLPAGARSATANSLKRNASYARVAGQSDGDVKANSALALAENGDFSQLGSGRQAFIDGRVTARGGIRRMDEAKRAGEIFDTMADKAQTVYSIKQDLLGLPPAKYVEYAKGMAEKFGAGSPQSQLVNSIAGKFLKQAQADPVGFVLNDPQLSKEYDAAMTGNDQSARDKVLGKVVAAQEAAGLKPRILTADRAQTMGQTFNAMLNGTTVYQQDPQTGQMVAKNFDASTAMMQLQGLRQQYGRYLPNVISDLSTVPDKDSRLPMAARFVLEMPANDMRGYIALANTIPPKDANGKIQNTENWGKTEGKDWELALNGNSDFKDFISAAGQTPYTIEDSRRMVTRIASSLMFTGQASNPSDAVKQAVGVTIGAVSSVKDGVIIPKYNDIGKARTYADLHEINANLGYAKKDFISSGNVTPPEYLMARFSDVTDPELKKKAVAQSLANETSWQTTQDGKGAQLMAGLWQNGRFVPMGPVKLAGKPIVMDFSSIENKLVYPGGLGDSILKSKAEKPDWSTLLRPMPAGDVLPDSLPSSKSASSGNLGAKLPDSLKGLSDVFEKQGSLHGVDPALLAAISMHETGQGTSHAFLNGNNAMGVSNDSGPISFGNPGDSIAQMAQRIGQGNLYSQYRKSGRLEDLAKVYAPVGAANDPRGLNGDWVAGVSKYYNQLKGM